MPAIDPDSVEVQIEVVLYNLGAALAELLALAVLAVLTVLTALAVPVVPVVLAALAAPVVLVENNSAHHSSFGHPPWSE